MAEEPGSGTQPTTGNGGNAANGGDFRMNKPTILSLLYLASFLAGVTSIVAIILAYVWNGEDHEGWEDTHYRYHIRTFWIGMVWTIVATIGSIVTLFLLAWILFPAVAIWFALRAIRSLMAAQREQPIKDVTTWLV